MHQHYTVHFAKGSLPRQPSPEGYFLDPELGHQKGCRHQWCHDPEPHRPCQPPPQMRWQLAYHNQQWGVGGCRRGPQLPVLQQRQQQQQRQPPAPRPNPLRQRLCPVPSAHKGTAPATTAPLGLACAPQPRIVPTTAPTTASSGPALPSATGALLEPGRPSDARPLPISAACGPFTSYSSDILTEDDVYCSCLAKTLCHVPVPVTVGFYAPFGCRLHLMLNKITALMEQQAAQLETEGLQSRARPVRGWGVPQLLWYLVFLQPIITQVHLRRKNLKFLFIRFSAWEYEGTDKLWAGLVTTLCEGIRHQYGALPFSVYSVLGNKPGTSKGSRLREWHCRRRVFLGLVALLTALGLGVALLYLSLGAHALSHSGTNSNLLRAVGGAATTLSGSGLLMAVFSVGKHLFVSQRKKIERLVSQEKFGSQLGFMCEVKKEVELVTDFLYFMEIYQQTRLRVVLQVTGLDTCYSEHVVGVLNAINTLLSDSHAPFIFILVVDPSILAACLESASSMKGTADNGYLFLNRTVTLPFSVPIMGRRTKLQFLHDAVQSRDDLLYRQLMRQLQPLSPGGDEDAQLLAVEMQEGARLTQSRIDAEAARRIQEALFCLHNEHDCLYEYIPDNLVSMRRIVNTVPITVRLLQQQQPQDLGGPTPRQAVAWIVLANQWPCRLSWALQCLEDRQQAGGAPGAQEHLWNVFRGNSQELHTMTKALKNVLDLDGDPELFQRFLSTDFPFTVSEAQTLLRCTVNLDHSIRRRMSLIRAVNALKPPSPPKSPAGDAPHPANGANPASRTGHPNNGANQASRTGQPANGANPASRTGQPANGANSASRTGHPANGANPASRTGQPANGANQAPRADHPNNGANPASRTGQPANGANQAPRADHPNSGANQASRTGHPANGANPASRTGHPANGANQSPGTARPGHSGGHSPTQASEAPHPRSETPHSRANHASRAVHATSGVDQATEAARSGHSAGHNPVQANEASHPRSESPHPRPNQAPRAARTGNRVNQSPGATGSGHPLGASEVSHSQDLLYHRSKPRPVA